VSRARQTAIALGLGVAALLGVAACSSGQVTQTDTMLPAVNGNMGQIGPIAIRDAMLAYPQGGGYQAGDDAPLILAIVNTGASADELVGVRSPVAGDAELIGDRDLPGGTSLAVGEPGEAAEEQAPPSSPTTTGTTPPSSPPGSPTSGPASPVSGSEQPTGPSPTESPRPTEPVEIGKLTVILTGLTAPVASGKTVPVTFVFRNAGSITLDLPVATPTTARPQPTETGSHG
jgi:copper(I)-binding protein